MTTAIVIAPRKNEESGKSGKTVEGEAFVTYVNKAVNQINNDIEKFKANPNDISIIYRINSENVFLHTIVETARKEGILSRETSDKIQAILDQTNKNIEDAAKSKGYVVGNVKIGSLGEAIHKHIKGESSAEPDLYNEYTRQHTIEGKPAHYALSKEEFHQKISDEDLLKALNEEFSKHPSNSRIGAGESDKDAASVIQNQPEARNEGYTVKGKGLLGKAIEGVTLDGFINNYTSISQTADNFLKSDKIAMEEYKSHNITNLVSKELKDMQSSLKTILEFAAKAGISTKYIEPLYKEITEMIENKVIPEDVNKLIMQKKGDWKEIILVKDIKGAKGFINDDIRNFKSYVSEENSRLTFRSSLEDLSKQIAKYSSSVNALASTSHGRSPEKLYNSIKRSILSLDNLSLDNIWNVEQVEQVYTLMAICALLDTFDAVQRTIVNDKTAPVGTLKWDMLKAIDSS